MPIGAAKDKADQIAKSHDDAYETASKWRPASKMPRYSDRMIHNKFEELIQTADEQAIKLFYQNFKDQLDIRSLMAAGGLKMKHVLENIFGVMYPKRKYFLL
ncbi:hypothetical protein TNCT_283541 [Trichonephila clavata]|uniref:Uncharacterized protein n=1 Tax=Trichonephila clavata TaxID=2740835 RepID=A0A8X6J711_TRICU|nr:hypothetical protein TNCT_283541 [Trichonephila clavata]